MLVLLQKVLNKVNLSKIAQSALELLEGDCSTLTFENFQLLFENWK